MNTPSAPAAPDFSSLAQQQYQLDQGAAYNATMANRFDQANPYGSMNWSQSKVMGPDGKPVTKWTSNVNLSPEQQQLFDRSGAAQRALAEKSPQYAQMVADFLSNPLDNGAGIRDRVESTMMGKLNQQSDRDLEALRSRLLNQGITENSEAWRREMQGFDENRQNARTSVLMSAGDAAQQQMGMDTGARSQYLNELSSILGQTAPTVPGYQYGQAVSAQAPNMYGAGQDQYAAALQNYNAELAEQGQMMNVIGNGMNAGARAYGGRG